MIFKKLKLRNIRSYEEVELEFPSGSVLLSGDIGSGKTSILLGLQFALFGLQPGQKGSSILRQGEDSAYACLEVELDGENIILERTIKKSKNGSISQDSNAIMIGGSREELSTLEMKDRVINLLNYPKEFVKKSNLLYKYTVYTPQEEMKEIVQERPEVRLDTLRHIFGIDRYKKIKDNANIFLQKIKESVKVKEVLASELNLIKEKFNIENEKKISLAREVNNLNIEYEKIFEEKKIAEDNLQEKQQGLDERRDMVSSLDKFKTQLDGKRDFEARVKREMASMQKQVSIEIKFSSESLKSVEELLQKHKNILEEKSEEFMEVNSSISVLESKKESPIRLKEKVISLENCPTCFQSVSDEHKQKISKRTDFEIEEINRELNQKIGQRENLIKVIEKEKDLVKGYESDKAFMQENKIKYEHQEQIKTKIKSDAFVLDRTSNEIKDLEDKIEEIMAKIETFSNSQKLFDLAKEEFQKINEAARRKEILKATKEKELELLKIRLEELSIEIKQKENIRKDVDLLRGLQDWIQEKFISMINLTEKNVMVKLRNELSKIFSEWFSILVSNSLSVRLDEEFTPIITNQDYEIEYDFLSGGERTATALAYRLSLNQVLNSMLSQIKTKDVIILDEPTDGFSTEQIEKMRDIFDQLNANQMILVSHEEKIEGFVDHVIRVQKEKNSKIILS